MIEKLFQEYEADVLADEKDGFLKSNTVRTYLHSGNFVKWCSCTLIILSYKQLHNTAKGDAIVDVRRL